MQSHGTPTDLIISLQLEGGFKEARKVGCLLVAGRWQFRRAPGKRRPRHAAGTQVVSARAVPPSANGRNANAAKGERGTGNGAPWAEQSHHAWSSRRILGMGGGKWGGQWGR